MDKRILWIPLGLMAVALLVWVGWLLTMVVNGILSVDDEQEVLDLEDADHPKRGSDEALATPAG